MLKAVGRRVNRTKQGPYLRRKGVSRGRGVRMTQQLLSARPQPRLITQNIRQSVVADDSLSTKGKNRTIITVDGTVTLHGPVKREKEE
jgi:osmotically-inducible protein OsmY